MRAGVFATSQLRTPNEWYSNGTVRSVRTTLDFRDDPENEKRGRHRYSVANYHAATIDAAASYICDSKRNRPPGGLIIPSRQR
jgi:hypothetical protein